MPARSNTNELKLTRVFDAPVRAVWEAWTDSAKVAHWWGPRGFSITTHHRDLRPGGTWVYTMHGPDGKDYPNITRYLEVEECAKLVYDHGATADTPPMFRVSVRFEEIDGKTTLHMTMTLATPEAAERTRQFIKKAGGDATWDRLAEYLTKERMGREKFVICRSFDAPLERVFEMWSEPEHLVRWLPPGGHKMECVRGEIRTGATALWHFQSGNVRYHARFEYLRVEKPRCIAYTQQFCDEQERAVRHPLAPTWPETMLTTVDFASEGPERTRVTVTSEISGTVPNEELETFVKGRDGMTIGWTGSLDKLEDLLEA